jgi:hypothetical protein
MQLYADLPGRRTRQAVADAVAVTWVILVIWLAKQAYDLVNKLAAPGLLMEQSGTGLASSMQGASDRVDGVPLAGDALAAPFDAAAHAASGIASAGQSQQDAVNNIAWLVAIVLAGGPILLALLVWALPRLVWMHRAQAARLVLLDRDGADLLALRALATRPLRQLADVGVDGVVDRWRRGDEQTIGALATLELRDLGLDPRRLPSMDQNAE